MTCLANQVASRFAELTGVIAVVEAGSHMAGSGDANSDIDLYVYAPSEPALSERTAIASSFANGANGLRMEIGNRFWEPGDEWLHQETGVHLDVMYRSPAWLEDQLERVLVRYEASVGYSTCVWWNVLYSRALFDRNGWYNELQAAARVTYPEPLRSAIVAKNRPLLRENLSSYRHQISLAVERGDKISVAHRTAAFLASYFDILFAMNETPHPGEKRLLDYAVRLCPRRPARLEELVTELLGPSPLRALDELCDRLNSPPT